MDIELSLVMPCYNEQDQIESAVKNYISEMKKTGKKFEIVLVNDGSLDNTKGIMENLSNQYTEISTIHFPENRGYGCAVRAGLAVSKGKILGWIDGDGQFGADVIIKAYDLLQSGKCGVCKGRRIIREDGTVRYVASIGYTALFNLFFLNTIKDTNSKPKLMTRDCYESIKDKLVSKHWFIDSEVLIRSMREGFNILDAPVAFRSRSGGKSTVSFKTVIEYIINIIKMRFGLMR